MREKLKERIGEERMHKLGEGLEALSGVVALGVCFGSGIARGYSGYASDNAAVLEIISAYGGVLGLELGASLERKGRQTYSSGVYDTAAGVGLLLYCAVAHGVGYGVGRLLHAKSS